MHERMQPFLKCAALFACPLCGGSLTAQETSLRCERGHDFALSSKGYGDFAPNQPPSLYDKPLFESRRRILAGPFYKPLTETLRKTLSAFAPAGPVLDAGCGEGSFLKALYPETTAFPLFGVDLSREGVRLAARGGGQQLFLVGDLTRLPFRDKTFSVLLNILSPACYPAFARVLTEEGILVKAVPEEGYLREIRTLAGERLSKERYSNEAVVSLFKEKFSLIREETVEAVFPVTTEEARDFLTMTPLTSRIDKKDLPAEKLREITVAMRILTGKKK